jgi:hypothetical protein
MRLGHNLSSIFFYQDSMSASTEHIYFIDLIRFVSFTTIVYRYGYNKTDEYNVDTAWNPHVGNGSILKIDLICSINDGSTDILL